jgi:NAD(P)-dependent dehydrogenase (short-subunit alcohol dehydrogenase family)
MCLRQNWWGRELAGGVIRGLSSGLGDSIDASVIPAERTRSGEDIAGVVLYMTSRAGAYLNGSMIVVDGGRFCRRRIE